jgi:beta-phosphoglucomutase-like phosphatase (HAD superfamily)
MHTTYIFDFDGTLVDSMPSWIGKILHVLKTCNVNYPENIAKIAVTLGDVGTARYFRENLGVKLSVEEIIALMDDFALPKYRDEIVLKDGVREYLELLRASGCSLNVLTASPHKMVDPCLMRNGVFDLFDNVWTCEDFGTS